MSYRCHECGTEVDLDPGFALGRRDTCPKCKADLHCCANCKFYETSAYNQCREPQAERVLDKATSNFCDYFTFQDSGPGGKGQVDKKNYLKQLDGLFK